MNLAPRKKFVLVELEAPPSSTLAGLHLLPKHAGFFCPARVLAIGGDVHERGLEGQRVLVGRTNARACPIGAEHAGAAGDTVFVEEDDVLAVLEETTRVEV